MPNRVLKDWTASETVDQLSVGAEIFFTRLIMKVDDFGNYVSNPKLLKSALFPLKEKLSLDEVSVWLNECLELKLIRRYSVNGREYLHIPNFDQKLRRMKNTYPPPSDSDFRTSDGQVTDISGQVTAETKGNETEVETKEKPITYSKNVFLNIQVAKVLNKPYKTGDERGKANEGAQVDELVEDLVKSCGWDGQQVLSILKAMKAVYQENKWSFPSRYPTLLEAIKSDDWEAKLKESDPDLIAENIHNTKQNGKRKPERDDIGTSAPGSLG